MARTGGEAVLSAEIGYLSQPLESWHHCSVRRDVNSGEGTDWIGREYTGLLRLGSTLVAMLAKPFQIQGLLKKRFGNYLALVPTELAGPAGLKCIVIVE